MIIDIKGILIGCENKSETTKQGKTFQCCEVLIDTQDKTNNIIMVKAKPNDPLITGQIGDEVKAGCFLNSREWNGKYFYDFKLMKMEVLQVAQGAVSNADVASSVADEQLEPDPMPF